MKKFVAFLPFLLVSFIGISQLECSDAVVTFHSEKDDITATNKSVYSTLSLSTGELTFSLKISEFGFANPTMQKHFNQEGVMNSIKFPEAHFKGKITNNGSIDYTADGSYDVQVAGEMTIKGVTKEFNVKGKIVIKGGKVSAMAGFDLDRFEYGVDAKAESVSQVLSIKVEAHY